MNIYLVYHRKTQKMTKVRANSKADAIHLVARSKKRMFAYTCDLDFDHDELQRQNIGIIGTSLVTGRPILVKFSKAEEKN